MLNYLYFSNFYSICWHTFYMPSESSESFPGKHLTSTTGIENRAVTCQGGVQCPIWALVSWKCLGVPCAAFPWDYPGFTGHAQPSWKLSESRDFDFCFQPLHWNTRKLSNVLDIYQLNFQLELFKFYSNMFYLIVRVWTIDEHLLRVNIMSFSCLHLSHDASV